MEKKQHVLRSFEKFAATIAKTTGSSITFLMAFAMVVVWGICGPIFQYSVEWQLIITTGTNIVTFLMVFIIQQAQNKDTMALQMKLNELIAATKGASNRVINIEDMTEEELRVLKKFYIKLSDLSEQQGDLQASHSVAEAEKNEAFKEKENTVAEE